MLPWRERRRHCSYGGVTVFEHELARSVLLERLIEANSPEVRFRKEWQALRAEDARISETEAEANPVDLFLQGKEIERAA